MLIHKGLAVDPNSCTVTYQGQVVPLTCKEYSLLLLFLQYPNHILNYEFIANKLWSEGKTPTASCVRSHIRLLRRSLKKANAPADIVENVHGIGYRLKSIDNAVVLPSAKDIAENQVVPDYGMLQKLLKFKEMEYLVLDSEYRIKYYSLGLPKYADFSQFVKVGEDVMNVFPEFVGLEKHFERVMKGEIPYFHARGISKFACIHKPKYMKYYVLSECDLHQSELQDKKLIFVFFEPASEGFFEGQRSAQSGKERCLSLQENKVMFYSL